MEAKKTKKEIVKMLLNQNLETQDEEDLIDLLIDSPLSVDVDKQEEGSITFGEKAADKISEAVGSWKFILIFCGFIVFWIILNGICLLNPIDPFPFILLNLLLSCVAAIQAPIIMMSQNRQAKKDSMRNHNDYRIDLKSELILESLHYDIDKLISNQKKIIAYIQKEEAKKEIEDKEM